jgi:branched-chain amino acid transport system substrate-binding protein
MEKVIKFFCIVGVVGLLFCFSISPSFAQVKVGVMFSMTGPGSPVGKVQLDGAKLAMKQVNDKGGVMLEGKRVKVEAVIRDDETKPDVAARRMRELVDENIKLVVGGTFAHVSQAINVQIRDGQALFMAPNGVEETIFRKDTKAPYYISSLGAVDGIGRMCADYVSKTYKPKHVVLFLPDYAYGRGAAKGANKVFSTKYSDIKITEIWSPVGTPDYTSYIIKIKEIKPDVVMMGHWGADAINALKQVHELGLKKDAKVFFNSIITAQAVGIPPEALEGVTLGMWWYHDLIGLKDPETVSAVDKLTEAWRKEYGEPPDPFAVFAYLGMQETLRGVELGNSLEPAKVYKAIMDKPDFMSVKGPATWRIDGRPSYKYAKFILNGKSPKEKKDKWDFAKVVTVYTGEELCLPLKEMGWE